MGQRIGVALVLCAAVLFAPGLTFAGSPISLTLTIHIGSVVEQAQAAWTGLLKEYMDKNPNVSITFQPQIGAMTQDEYNTKLLVDLKAGTGPDIFAPTESTLIKFIRARAVVPAPDDLAAYVRREAINAAAQDSVVGPDRKTYGVPYLGDWPALFYNQEMYQKAGITKPPANWAELVDTAKKLTKTDDKGNILVSGFFVRKSGAQLGTFEKWYPFFTGNGGKLFSDDMKQVTLNSPEGVEALQFYVDLIYKDKVDSFQAPKGDTDGFIAGNVAQYLREPSNIAGFRAKAPNLKFATVLIPSGKVPARGMATITPLSVSAVSKNPGAAWDLIRWLSSTDVAGRLYQTLVLQPILKGAADRPFFKEDRAMQAFLVQPADVFPLHVRAHDMEIVMGKAVEAALQQKGSPKQVLDAAAKEVADLLEQD